MKVVINTAYLALSYNIEKYYHFIIRKLKDFTDYAVIMRHSLCSVSNACVSQPDFLLYVFINPLYITLLISYLLDFLAEILF